MASFVLGYKHDIFVSYAHVDDEPVPGADEGWVTTLVKCLRTQLSQKLGRNNAFSLWIDHSLAGNVQVTDEIMSTLRESATLVVILSPGYIASHWCLEEKDAFLEAVAERVRSGSRVFAVERDKMKVERDGKEQDLCPSELRDKDAYRFWVEDPLKKRPRTLAVPKPDPNDPTYYNLISDLAYDLSEELIRLKTAATSPTSEPDTCPFVLLAEVTDDLDTIRNGVKRYLQQAKIRVLPETQYSLGASLFQQSLEQDLDKCKVFIQLLSDTPGKKPPDLPQGYPRLQYDVARNRDTRILQWRSRELDVNSVQDDQHRAMLEFDTVLAVGIEEFKSEVVRRAFEKPATEAPERLNAFVFIDTEKNDFSLGETVCRVLDKYADVDYALSLSRGKPGKMRQDLREKLALCDALIIIYGSATKAWVHEQLNHCRKAIVDRKEYLPALAIYEGPPEKKGPLGFKLRGMKILHCCGGLNEAELKAFLDSLRMK